ncbi:tyrosine--tRNA ligase [Candidatus Thorarchaeota archaeon]|nr:MAG: tyrosine--tRNA ligase [Candidatus Thorarchaeota archaeon]
MDGEELSDISLPSVLMDLDEQVKLIAGVGEEIVTMPELRQLLEEKKNPIAYDGFEPSGLAHLPFGVYRPLLLKDLIKAGITFKIWLADWFAWINNKMDGDLEKIRHVGEYFIEVWKAAGVPTDKVEFLWASEAMDSIEYWSRVVKIAKSTTVARATRALTIMGRREGEMKEVAQYFYPMMQVADIFHLEADITQLGLDQRRANILAREVGPKLGWWKPVVISHHMLMNLEGAAEPEGYDEEKGFDVQISSKMSKSKPESSIFVHDSIDQIREKIMAAFCPPKQAEGNPLLDYAKEIVFRGFDSITVERKPKFGGDIDFNTYAELEEAYVSGDLHPLDLKNTMVTYLDKMVAPVRTHFEKKKSARELLELVRGYQVTR